MLFTSPSFYAELNQDNKDFVFAAMSTQIYTTVAPQTLSFATEVIISVDKYT
jgi:hypothetical protein